MELVFWNSLCLVAKKQHTKIQIIDNILVISLQGFVKQWEMALFIIEGNVKI